MSILHLTADYPDPLAPGKTRAIRNLLALAPGHDHRVYSLTRIGPRGNIAAMPFSDMVGEDHRAVAYPAPPAGILMVSHMHRLAAWLIADIERRGLKPRLVHAHKLSVEGLAGEIVAGHFGVPLVLNCQGDSDTRILSKKPEIRHHYRRIWQGAAEVLPFAPWAHAAIEAMLGRRRGPVTVLPCAAAGEQVFQPSPGPEDPACPVIAAVFHFESWKRKNAGGLFRAVAQAAHEVEGLELQLIGGGGPADFAAVSDLVAEHGGGRVRLLGRGGPEEIRALLSRASAFALPSLRETFGMVFVEALFAGCPILYPDGASISGFLDRNAPWAVPLPATDGAAWAAGIAAAARESESRRAALCAAATRGELDQFTNRAIGAAYRAALARALE